MQVVRLNEAIERVPVSEIQYGEVFTFGVEKDLFMRICPRLSYTGPDKVAVSLRDGCVRRLSDPNLPVRRAYGSFVETSE